MAPTEQPETERHKIARRFLQTAVVVDDKPSPPLEDDGQRSDWAQPRGKDGIPGAGVEDLADTAHDVSIPT